MSKLKRSMTMVYLYVLLFARKQFRSSFSKKMSYMNDEFNYLSPGLRAFLSRTIAFIEIMVVILLPITASFYPVVYKYAVLGVLFVTYALKMKTISFKGTRMFVHQLFVKDAVFHFYGIVLISLNLILLLDLRIFIIMAVILGISLVKADYVNSVVLYIYSALYIGVFVYSIAQRTNSALVVVAAVMLAGLLALYRYGLSGTYGNAGRSGHTTLLFIHIKMLVRKMFSDRNQAIWGLFPVHLLIYPTAVHLLQTTSLMVKADVPEYVYLLVYFIIYYIYSKLRMVAFDECFYFSSTRLELLRMGGMKQYFRKMTVLTLFSLINMWWGVVYLLTLLPIPVNAINAALLIVIHFCIIIVAWSPSIFIEKNKAEVTRQPEDFKRYVGLLEGVLIMTFFVFVSIYSSLGTGTDVPGQVYDLFYDWGHIIAMIFVVALTGAVIALFKAWNDIRITERNIRRGV